MSMQIFTHQAFGQVRTVMQNDEPWFVAKDVAEVLGYANPRKAILDHCKGGNKTLLPTHGGTQEVTIIPERDLYRLIMRSRLPQAENFEEWVVSEVLPSIRKHGAYMTPQKLEEALTDPDTIIRLATTIKEEQEHRKVLEREKERLQNQIALDRHKVVFAESIEVAETSILVRELAKLIQQSTSYRIGQQRLFEWLRDNGYLIRARGTDYNMPTQRSMDLGLFEVKEGSYSGSSGTHLTKTAKVTGKGQTYFINKFMKIAQDGPEPPRLEGGEESAA